MEFKTFVLQSARALFRLSGTVAVGLAVMLGAGTAAAQTLTPTGKEDLRKALSLELAKYAQNRAVLETLAQRQYPKPLTPPQLDVSVRQFKVLYEHPDMPEAVAGLIAPLLREGLTQTEYQQALSTVLMSIPVRGLIRMDAESQRFFVGYTLGLFQAVTPDVCKKIQLQQLTMQEMAKLERGYIQSLPLEAFEQTTQMFLTSALAEISKSALVRKPTPQQVEVSEKVWRNRFEAVVQRSLSAAAIARVGNSMEAAPAPEVCEVGKSVLKAMLDMEEPYRTWRISAFLGALQ